jgi:hypothetical protein
MWWPIGSAFAPTHNRRLWDLPETPKWVAIAGRFVVLVTREKISIKIKVAGKDRRMKRRQIIGGAAALAVTAYGIKAWSAEPIRIDLDAVLTGAGADIGERIRKVAQWAVE